MNHTLDQFLYFSSDIRAFLERFGEYIEGIDLDYTIYDEIRITYHPKWLEIEIETIQFDGECDCFWITHPPIIKQIMNLYFGTPKTTETENKTKTLNSKGVNEDMNITKGLTFDFGTCENDKVRMSAYGLAIKNEAGTWVSYDTKTKSIMDVDILNFECGKYLFKMPVAISAVKAGDVVIHNRVPMFVTGKTDTSIAVVDIHSGEEKNIVPTKNIFNFNYLTKVVSMFDFSKNNASEENPFGNMLPFLMMADSKGGDNLLPLVLMSGNGAFDMNNPMMLYALCGSDNKDLLPFMLMSGGLNAPKTESK